MVDSNLKAILSPGYFRARLRARARGPECQAGPRVLGKGPREEPYKPLKGVIRPLRDL